MKRLAGTVMAVTLMSGVCFAGEQLSVEEQSTVDKLHRKGIVNNLHLESPTELNQPISKIDAMSLTIKAKADTDADIANLRSETYHIADQLFQKQAQDDSEDVTYDDLEKLEANVKENENQIKDNDAKLKEMEERHNRDAMIGLVLFVIACIL